VLEQILAGYRALFLAGCIKIGRRRTILDTLKIDTIY